MTDENKDSVVEPQEVTDNIKVAYPANGGVDLLDENEVVIDELDSRDVDALIEELDAWREESQQYEEPEE